MEDVDHARRFALLLASSLGTFVFLAVWLALEWNGFLAVLIGVAAGTLVFYPLRLLMGQFFRPPRRRRRVVRKPEPDAPTPDEQL